MEKSDKIFLIWSVIVMSFLVLMSISETTLEFIQTYGFGTVIGEYLAIIGFFVVIPYVIHRWIVKRKF